MERSPIRHDVDSFVEAVSNDLAGLSGREPSAHVQDAAVEAANLVAAVIDADNRATDAELWAYVDGVGRLLEPPVVDTPARLREARVTVGRQFWLESPSTLLDLLVRADARDGGRRAESYYGRALALAHAVAAVDLVPSAEEIAAVDRFRSTILRVFDSHGVPRPGAPRRPVEGTPGASSGPAGPDTDAAGRRPVGTPGSGSPAPTATAGAGATAPATPDPAEMPPAESLEELLAELDELVGLDAVKAEVRRLTSLLRVQQLRAERGLKVYETSHHLVFTGNPGTGKTTVARLISRIYRSLGVVTKGHLVETDRSVLVAGYVGQTAAKTKAVLEESLGGTLLIDEAYALARGGENDFGREAIDTLVKFMEDHRDDVAIVAAGYPEEMTTFIDANPGLKSRFTRTLHFSDYTTEELVEIFAKLGERNEYRASEGALATVAAVIATEPRDRGFGNARYVRNLFEAAVAHQAGRVSELTDPDTEQLSTLIAADILDTSVGK